jgi:hypothetical protein
VVQPPTHDLALAGALQGDQHRAQLRARGNAHPRKVHPGRGAGRRGRLRSPLRDEGVCSAGRLALQLSRASTIHTGVLQVRAGHLLAQVRMACLVSGYVSPRFLRSLLVESSSLTHLTSHTPPWWSWPCATLGTKVEGVTQVISHCVCAGRLRLERGGRHRAGGGKEARGVLVPPLCAWPVQRRLGPPAGRRPLRLAHRAAQPVRPASIL